MGGGEKNGQLEGNVNCYSQISVGENCIVGKPKLFGKNLLTFSSSQCSEVRITCALL